MAALQRRFSFHVLAGFKLNGKLYASGLLEALATFWEAAAPGLADPYNSMHTWGAAELLQTTCRLNFRISFLLCHCRLFLSLLTRCVSIMLLFRFPLYKPRSHLLFPHHPAVCRWDRSFDRSPIIAASLLRHEPRGNR